jgi:Cu(I)/Ag(I) efflux system membrane protein CusA/SilA
MLHRIIKFLIENKLVALAILLLVCLWGMYHSPFQLAGDFFPKDSVAVDAIPDIGENQQILYTEWKGQSPEEIENQITYPLTSHLLGMSGVKTIRSTSMFGFSSIYVIFEDDVDFYWSRNRIIEKINSLPKELLPPDVTPSLGPDATAMGQVFWYTLEGRDEKGKVTGGWDLHELRSVQDFFVRNALAATPGISEIASIGGFVKEYQIDLNPELMRQYDVPLSRVVEAVQESNKDVGARTLEINNVEYFIRGIGYLETLRDIENIPLGGLGYTPIFLKDIATVTLGPAERRGILDKGGAEVVGGVAISQHGSNPMQVIKDLKKTIERTSPGLPSKLLGDGRRSQLTIVPFYDRSVLIRETLNTLGTTLGFEILITILVVIVMLSRLRISLIISSLMPIVVLAVFGLMHLFEVDANIVALSGIAIAIGTLVDMGIILTENMVRHIEMKPNRPVDEVIYEATTEVSGAIMTAGLTTVVSFIPVFSLTGAEGKLFTPLAFTKTAALGVAILMAVFIIPPLASFVLRKRSVSRWAVIIGNTLLLLIGFWILFHSIWAGIGIVFLGGLNLLVFFQKLDKELANKITLVLVPILILGFLAYYWRPLGYTYSFMSNAVFVIISAVLVLGLLFLFKSYYERLLNWALAHKIQFISIPIGVLLLGMLIMLNSEKEFMPSLDEGSFLLMPVSMPHAGVSENGKVLKKLDMAVAKLPEVEMVVGKAGRVESALDPAPLSMYENLIIYKPEFILDSLGRPAKFKVDDAGMFQTKDGGRVGMGAGINQEDLILDNGGDFYRNWRPHIRSKSQIWDEIIAVTGLPGVTTPPKLQPIETRLVMLQTGMRSSMGIKIKGQDLSLIENFGIQLESHIKEVEGIAEASVFADRIVAKPYLELTIDRAKAARYKLSVNDVQQVIEVAIGGKVLSYSVEGRERYGIRVRYPREMRASPEDIQNIYLDVENGSAIPLSEVAVLSYSQGPQQIKSEDSFLVGYVIFDKEINISEITAVERVRKHLYTLIEKGELQVPESVSFEFDGNYQNQIRAEKQLSFLIPLVLIVIFMILYVQFKSAWLSLMVFTGVAVSFAGGFMMIWLYGQPWFMDFGLPGLNFRESFGIGKVNLSVAVWVGFIALFGIATDDGVVMGSYLKTTFNKNQPSSIHGVRASVVEAGLKRIRPCLMTTATTILALLPILTSKGRGSDVMVSMAIPCFGGMLMALLSLFMVPVLYSWREELRLKGK